MDKIPLTNYQFISYFMSGFAFVVCIFITAEPIHHFDDLLTYTKDLSIGFLSLSILISILLGLIFDAVRNGIIDNFIDWLIKKGVVKQKYRVDWSYFYKAKSKEVGYFYARYFTYYYLAFNLFVSILASMITIQLTTGIPYKNVIFLIISLCILFLAIDALALRVEMGKVTAAGPFTGQTGASTPTTTP